MRVTSAAALALALLASTAGAALAADQPVAPQPASPQPAAIQPAASQPADPIVAIVNGAEIRRSELEVTQRRLPEQYRQLPLQVIYDPLLDQVINGRLLAAEAKKSQLESRPEVQAEITAAVDEVLRDNFVQQAVETGATPDKLRAAYDALKTQPGFAAEEVHARHVLVASEGEAREVLAQLGGGADFGELAKTRSTDPSAKTNGGDLGYFGRDAMVPEFADAAFTIPLGTVGKDPVQSQFGWHVIKVEDRRQTIPTFEEKEPELREQVAREIVNALVTQIRGGAQVQRFGLDGTPNAQPQPQLPPQ
jgi:peptidyl-prolyl cis-trans isomerase C